MYRFASLVTILTIIVLHSTNRVQAQGLLRAATNETRTVDPPSSSSDDEPEHKKKKKSYSSSDDGDACDDADAQLTIMGLYATGVVVTSPYWAPVQMLGDSQDQPGLFQRFPNDIASGYMLKGEEWSHLGKPLSIRASTEYETDFQDLSRIGTKLLVEGTGRWGIDTQWNEYFENNPAGGTDELTTGDLNLVYRFAESEYAQFRSGLGVNYLSDQIGTEWGINFTYAADVYPCDNVIWSSELDVGKVGSASLLNIRSTGGLQWKRAEMFGGFQYTNFEGTELSGFITGFRFWF